MSVEATSAARYDTDAREDQEPKRASPPAGLRSEGSVMSLPAPRLLQSPVDDLQIEKRLHVVDDTVGALERRHVEFPELLVTHGKDDGVVAAFRE
jgi:hypothetical protein